jgi:hypothetical protein
MTTQLTDAECAAFWALRVTYQTDEHLFTERDLSHLRFLRWLVRSPVWDRAMDSLDEMSGPDDAPQEIAVWTTGLCG